MTLMGHETIVPGAGVVVVAPRGQAQCLRLEVIALRMESGDPRRGVVTGSAEPVLITTHG